MLNGRMQIGIWHDYSNFHNNRIFDPNSYPIGENLAGPVIYLRMKLSELNIDLTTLDVLKYEVYDKAIFIDYPKNLPYELPTLIANGTHLYLFVTESELINTTNLDRSLHGSFKKIFTYDDRWIDGNKYIKYNLPNDFPKVPPIITPFQKQKLCVMIVGNKAHRGRGELYSERLRSIRWFEENHPEKFDLYGIGWDRKIFSGLITQKFNRFSSITTALRPLLVTYRGRSNGKLETLRRYKFSICYENIDTVPGYISEKIFDCFFSGCIPIYLGAPNVLDYIPKECFIDRRDFKSYSELYQCISSMSEQNHKSFLSAAAIYLQSSAGKAFSSECYAKRVIESIIVN